jgi:hypothetical protein
VFGLPLAIARRRALRQGLPGEDRGEGLIASIHSGYAVCSGILLYATIQMARSSFWLLQYPSILGERKEQAALAVSLLAIACSLSALALSIIRHRARARFVARTERGELTSFRVETTAKGKVLYRITKMGEGYRVADLTEELLTLERAEREVETSQR